jgi:hypothetical protein
MPNFIHKINDSSRTNFILLAAGKNKTKGQNVAKGLTDVNGKKLIDSQISVINKTCKNKDIIYAVGDRSKSMINYMIDNHPQVRIVENTKFKTTNPLESLRMSLNCATQQDTCIIYGDKIFNKGSITFESNDSPFIVETTECESMPLSLGLVYQKETLKNISYGVDNAWGQIFYIPNKLFNNFKKRINNLTRSYYNVFDFINLIAKEYKFKIHKSKNIKEI